MEPLVSVILPTYNRERLLPRAVNSVLAQSYSNLECIVVDDASTDNTAEVAYGFNNDPRFRYFRHHSNKNGSASRNTGISNARGELIAFLDDDDEWDLTKIEKQVRLIRSLSEKVGLVYCWMDYIDKKGAVIRRHHPANRGNVFDRVLDNNRIGGCPTLLLRRSVFASTGMFNDKLLSRHDDHDFIVRACRHFEVDYVPEVLVKVYHDHGFRKPLDERTVFTDSLKSYLARLDYFGEDLQKYPRQLTSTYSVIANMYGRLKNWGECSRYFRKALGTYAFNISIYRNLLSLLKYMMMKTCRIGNRVQ